MVSYLLRVVVVCEIYYELINRYSYVHRLVVGCENYFMVINRYLLIKEMGEISISVPICLEKFKVLVERYDIEILEIENRTFHLSFSRVSTMKYL